MTSRERRKWNFPEFLEANRFFPVPERESFIENLLVRIHCIIVIIRWTGLAPWEFERPVPFRFGCLSGSVPKTTIPQQFSTPPFNALLF